MKEFNILDLIKREKQDAIKKCTADELFRSDAFGLYETYKSKQTLSEYADFKVAYYAAINEASMRLKGGLIVPLWEIMDINRLKHEMEKIRQ